MAVAGKHLRWHLLRRVHQRRGGRQGFACLAAHLAAFGFSGGPGSAFADIPTLVGPFNVFDARVFLSQAVLDLGALNSVRAEAHNVEAARLTFKSARDFVIHVAGNLFVQVLAAAARVGVARGAAPVAPGRDDALEAHGELRVLATPQIEDAREALLSPGEGGPRGEE